VIVYRVTGARPRLSTSSSRDGGEKARIALPVAVQYSGSRPATRDSCFSPRCPMIFSTYITSRPSWIAKWIVSPVAASRSCI
jgi:hypothetical protein